MEDLNFRVFSTLLHSIGIAKNTEILKAEIHHCFGGTILYAVKSSVRKIQIFPIQANKRVAKVLLVAPHVELAVTSHNFKPTLDQFLDRIHIAA